MIFLVVNLALGITLVMVFRALTRRFVSLYLLNDATLVFLSLLQALVLHCWRQRSK